jgi:hypothetical protein
MLAELQKKHQQFAEAAEKINYLRRFIANLAGEIDSLLPLVRLKHEEEFT